MGIGSGWVELSSFCKRFSRYQSLDYWICQRKIWHQISLLAEPELARPSGCGAQTKTGHWLCEPDQQFRFQIIFIILNLANLMNTITFILTCLIIWLRLPLWLNRRHFQSPSDLDPKGFQYLFRPAHNPGAEKIIFGNGLFSTTCLPVPPVWSLCWPSVREAAGTGWPTSRISSLFQMAAAGQWPRWSPALQSPV